MFYYRHYLLLLAILTGFPALVCHGQELEARRWTHLPMDINFAGAGYAYTTGDIALDPVLLIDDGEFEGHSVSLKYIRTFEFIGKSARVDLIQGYQDVTWNGLLQGAPASVYRSGLSDASFRFAVNLLGAPPLKGKEFAEYRAKTKHETIAGVALVTQLPTGNYLDDKLLNLGANRFTFRPQAGLVHNSGKWMTELTGATWFFTDNDDFFNGNYLEQAPLYTLQGHLVYTFRPGLWAGTGVAYGIGGESTLNGVDKDDRRGNLVWSVSTGIPVSKTVGISLTYLAFRTQEDVGSSSDNLAAGITILW